MALLDGQPFLGLIKFVPFYSLSFHTAVVLYPVPNFLLGLPFTFLTYTYTNSIGICSVNTKPCLPGTLFDARSGEKRRPLALMREGASGERSELGSSSFLRSTDSLSILTGS